MFIQFLNVDLEKEKDDLEKKGGVVEQTKIRTTSKA